MNTQARGFPLWAQFFIVVGAAIILPTIVMLVIIVDSTNRLNQQNLEAVVQRTGQYREYLIRTDFAEAQRLINAALSNEQLYGRMVFSARNLSLPDLTDETRQRLGESTTTDIRRILFANESRLLKSFWFLSPEGNVLIASANGNRTLPFNVRLPQENQSTSFLRGQELAASNETQAFVVASRNGLPNFEFVTVLRDAAQQVVGYFIVDLDINQIVLRHFTDTTTIPAYSFMVMPDGNTTIQQLEIRRQNLVDTRSPAVQRALEGQTEGVLAYRVGTTNLRDVIGYYNYVDILGVRLGFLTEVDQGLVIGQRVEYLSQIGFPILLAFVGLLLVLGLILTQIVSPPLSQLRRAIQSMTRGNFDSTVSFTERPDEIGALGTEFVDMRQQVKRLMDDLQGRLNERNRDVRLTQEISRAALAQRDLQALLGQFVTLIADTFPNIYHAQVFLLDQSERYAMLRASTGRAGQTLLQRGHRLEVGSVSVIGQVTEQGQLVLVRDIGASAVHRQNEFLKDTQAELAIPLRLGDRIIGALDVQSKERDSFTEAQITALQTLADQITIAVENARLFEQSQRLLRTVEQETRQRTQRSWQEMFTMLHATTLSGRAGNQTDYDSTSLRESVARSGKTVVATRTDRQTIPVGVPVRLRGQVVGVVEFELREADYSYGKVLLAEELVNRLAISLDNARLFLESARVAEREHLVNDISNLLTTENTVKGIMETAIREVSTALGTPQVGVRFRVSGLENGDEALSDDPTLVTSPASEGRVR